MKPLVSVSRTNVINMAFVVAGLDIKRPPLKDNCALFVNAARTYFLFVPVSAGQINRGSNGHGIDRDQMEKMVLVAERGCIVANTLKQFMMVSYHYIGQPYI